MSLITDGEKVVVNSRFKGPPISFFFPQNNRLKHKSEFDLIFNHGERIAGRHTIIFYNRHPDGKAAFVAGKRVGNAIKRNQCKRKLRELYRTSPNPIKTRYNMIFFAKTPLLTTPYPDLKKDFNQLLERIPLSQKMGSQ